MQFDNESQEANFSQQDNEESPLLQADNGTPINTNTANSSKHAISFFTALRIPGVIEFSICLFFAKLVSYTFLYWLPRYINISSKFFNLGFFSIINFSPCSSFIFLQLCLPIGSIRSRRYHRWRCCRIRGRSNWRQCHHLCGDANHRYSLGN